MKRLSRGVSTSVLIFSVLFGGLLSGCATQSFSVSGGAYSEPEMKKTQAFYFSGISQKQVLDAARICGGAEKVIKVESTLRFADILASVLTVGIYTPRTAKVYCYRESQGE